MFRDRSHAGRVLVGMLTRYAGRPDVVVLALPRGGVPVGAEVARILGAALDVFLVRKLGVPGREELAMGAFAAGGVLVVNDEVVSRLGIPEAVIAEVAAEERQELDRRAETYPAGRLAPNLRGKTVILVDDGLATGSTMRAAVAAVRQLGPASVVVAVPLGALETCSEFRAEADDVICAATPEPFFAVGSWYQDFAQTTDDEVRELLAQSRPTRDEEG